MLENPQKTMFKFTFIFEYNGGTYVRQLSCLKLSVAIFDWADNIEQDIPHFTPNDKQAIYNEIKVETPCLLSGLSNVWCIVLKVGDESCLLNIVATIDTNILID